MYEKFIFVIKIMIIKFEGIILAREVRGRALSYFPGGTYKAFPFLSLLYWASIRLFT